MTIEQLVQQVCKELKLDFGSIIHAELEGDNMLPNRIKVWFRGNEEPLEINLDYSNVARN